jgi:hypothetical protein
MKYYRLTGNEFRKGFKRFKIIWSDDESLPTATSIGISGYSNTYKNFTYRQDTNSIQSITRSEYWEYEKKFREHQPEAEKRKNEILTDFYLTGRVAGEYFGIFSDSSTNPVKLYIKKYLKMNHLDFENELLDDCYNEAFMHLAKIKPEKIIHMYETNKSHLVALTLRIIIWQCFSVDKRYPKPTKIAKMVQYASAFDINNFQIQTSEIHTDMANDNVTQTQELIIYDEPYEPSKFELMYGFEVEDIIDDLSDDDKGLFYYMLDNKKFHHTISDKAKERLKPEHYEAAMNLESRIKEIKNKLTNDR